MRDDSRRQQGLSRRHMIAGAGASAIALSAGSAAGSALAQRQTIARGTVFEDRRGQGVRRPGDPGIAGVMVSNGRDVVTTASDGRWRLPVAPGDSVFVIKPSHWATPLGDGGVPRFAYLHHPRGTPTGIAYRHAGVDPTGPLPASIDFGLQRRPEGSRFEALLVTDTQPENTAELNYLRDDIVASMMGYGAAFGINHGDVMFDDLSLYARYLGILNATGIAWHHCPGNHDMNSEASDDALSRETWKRIFGARHYAFQHGGATFIVLDNVHYFGYNPGAPRSGQYQGMIGERQLAFVRKVLAHVAPDALVVLSMHIPLMSFQDAGHPAENTVDRAALLQLLSGRRHTVSFSGHMHTTEHHYLGREQGFLGAQPHHHHVLTAASGGWWSGPYDRRGIPTADSPDGSPNGFHVLTVDGSSYATRFVPAAEKAAGQLRVLVDGPTQRAMAGTRRASGSGQLTGTPVPADAVHASELVVNVFDGGPRTKVVFEIGRAQQVSMQRASVLDPFIVDMFSRQAAHRKAWVEPVCSSHVWKGSLPVGLAPGAHRVTVRATDEYGREHVAHLVFEIGPAGHTPQPA
jgi:hypothetical protein